MKVQFDSETDRDKNRQCITSGIKHWGLSGYSSVLPRIKFCVTGQDSSPQSPTISYRRPLAFIEIKKNIGKNISVLQFKSIVPRFNLK